MDISPIARLAGSEVVLRPLVMEDAEALALAASESTETYGYTLVPHGLEQAKAYIQRALGQNEAGVRMPFAIEWQGRVVGSTSLFEFYIWRWPEGSDMQRTDTPDVVEIGHTWLAASAQRTRCNTEAKYLLLTQAFEAWQVHRVAFRTDERNARSRNAILRIGATFEGIRRADMPSVDGMVRNSASFSIIQEEWPTVKENLLSVLKA